MYKLKNQKEIPTTALNDLQPSYKLNAKRRRLATKLMAHTVPMPTTAHGYACECEC